MGGNGFNTLKLTALESTGNSAATNWQPFGNLAAPWPRPVVETHGRKLATNLLPISSRTCFHLLLCLNTFVQQKTLQHTYLPILCTTYQNPLSSVGYQYPLIRASSFFVKYFSFTYVSTLRTLIECLANYRLIRASSFLIFFYLPV